ncbi:nitrogenase cofactor biosynthesis protein NifB [Desulfocurvibacter africanus]|uniref:nitrogenase cofactor biosynthesis protein NifB n=1 Tax=Desulfocurvibacter africanus TaxID=873 RepID=UPI0004163D2D|nr:nitrogenase cofactor biosynthesis protein NifB [Desulfocurvibacter africanus]
MTMTPDISRHPCFNKSVSGQCGRIHLPVAPACNIQCRYCNRKYDCVNESRPGVTSGVLTPPQAAAYLDRVLEKEPRITVVGIAGPGDPFANAEATLATIRLIRERHPEMLFCVSTNGLGLPPYLDRVKDAGITHMTVTVNAVDPAVGKRFYSWVRDGERTLHGREAAELLLMRQLESIRGLKERGITVKVNTILTPGYNDGHIEELAKAMASMSVDMLNVMPLHPTADTPFEGIREPDKAFVEKLRKAAEQHLPQMRHCRRCRADAVGLLGNDRSGEFAGCLSECGRTEDSACGGLKALPVASAVSAARAHAFDRPHVAVASLEGLLVNKHLGESEKFQIWTRTDNGYEMIEERPAPDIGAGPKRWYALADSLSDCRAVLVARLGETPRAIMEEQGLLPVETEGFIEEALDAVYNSVDPRALQALRPKKRKTCAAGCSGGGEGCG